jgi:hypothetical protein
MPYADLRGIRTWYRHVGDAKALEPVAQRQQLAGNRGELGPQLRAPAPLIGTCTQAVTRCLWTSSAQQRSMMRSI